MKKLIEQLLKQQGQDLDGSSNKTEATHVLTLNGKRISIPERKIQISRDPVTGERRSEVNTSYPTLSCGCAVLSLEKSGLKLCSHCMEHMVCSSCELCVDCYKKMKRWDGLKMFVKVLSSPLIEWEA